MLIQEAHERQGETVSYDQAARQIAQEFHMERFLEHRLRDLSEPIRHLIGLDGLFQEHMPEVLEEDASVEREQVQRAVIEAAGWARPRAADAVLEEYSQYAVHRYEKLRQKLAERAYHRLVPADKQRLYGWIAGVYVSGDRSWPKAIYRAAYFQVLAHQWGQAITSLLRLAKMPDQLFSGRCRSIYNWAEQALKHAQPAERRELLELRGDCAAYLGQYAEAAEHYNKVKYELPKNDLAYHRLLARLVRVYAARGEKDRLRSTCSELLATTQATDPLHAFALAHQDPKNLFADPEQASAALSQAIVSLGEPRETWGREEKALWVRLHDTFARAEMYRDRAEQAREALEKVLPYAEGDLSLLARIKSNLAVVRYYLCEHPDDLEAARDLFTSALEIRQEIQDQAGVMYTAQNLASLCNDLAVGASDWDEAERYFRRAEQAATDVQAADRDMIIANYIDLLIHRGEFPKAEAYFARVTLPDVRDEATRVILLLNRAKLALWADDAPACQQYLTEALSPISDVDSTVDRLEWSQIALECHIRLGAPLDATAGEWLGVIDYPDGQQPDAAECFLAQGLLMLARADYLAARRHLGKSYEIWSALAYRFRATIVQYWQAYCEMRAGNREGAREILASAEPTLQLFGETPILRRLRRLRQQIDQEA
jgi:tetratricopeptide (TPR) repeat protein